jgi:uncharacterized protein YjbI with pentapeptide repeats
VTVGLSGVVVGLVWLVFWPMTDLITSHDLGIMKGPTRTASLPKARDAARGRIIQFGAGLLGLGAFVFTVRNFTLARQQSELNRQTLLHAMEEARRQAEATHHSLEQSEAVQITDRFARAIEQLGSTAIDARLGAIYSLERVARDSGRDHPAVMEVLTAFIRRTSQSRDFAVPQDLQAAATVVCRRQAERDRATVNLRSARLHALDLTAAILSGADLSECELGGAVLNDGELSGAKLNGADLAGAELDVTCLRGADLSQARLTSAKLRAASLVGAVLAEADLTGADLRDACLRGVPATGSLLKTADLGGADLTKANLCEADLTRARLNSCAMRGALLRSAKLTGADLTGADLSGADLTGAVLSNANLHGVTLSGANLSNSNLSGARLDGAILSGVDLTRVGLAGLDLTDAIADDRTRLPSRWYRTNTGRISRERARH